MKLRGANRDTSVRGSILVIVLWVSLGLVAITLYFANSTSSELKASENRTAALAAEQAIEGAARYAAQVLLAYSTNGVPPDPSMFQSQNVPVGEARFWFIGRDTNNMSSGRTVYFGLVDEAAKLNINKASSNSLAMLPYMPLELVTGILEWRNPEGGMESQMYYAMQHPAYEMKAGPLETTEELRLIYGADKQLLVGEDLNRNGVLDPNETDLDRDSRALPGLLDFCTVYSREPITWSNGMERINISNVNPQEWEAALEEQFGLSESRAREITAGLGQRPQFRSPLEFYRRSRMTLEEFAAVAPGIRTGSSTNYIEGRININTASAEVLSTLPGMTLDLAETLVEYRRMSSDRLTSIAWIVEALGENNSAVLEELQAEDCITTQSFQYTADIAAVGQNGRGYRRVRFVIDVSTGTPVVVYRQDLSHLGWALGREAREELIALKNQK